jgi:tRNA1Val (adenine37-N6)-methyltransferase
MMAQRYELAEIIGIEIDSEAIIDANTNVNESLWASRITIDQGDFLSINFKDKFDLIISNPPFFPQDTPSPLQKRAMARSGFNHAFSDWLLKAHDLMDKDGVFAFVLPLIQWEELQSTINSIGLYAKRVCTLKPNAIKAAHRVLVELQLSPSPKIGSELLIIETEKRHQYTASYIELTKDFYLNKA